VTAVARAGAVVVAESARDAIGSAADFICSSAGARHLKGVKGEVQLYRARAANCE
jgi:adenylate cyclase